MWPHPSTRTPNLEVINLRIFQDPSLLTNIIYPVCLISDMEKRKELLRNNTFSLYYQYSHTIKTNPYP